MQVQLFLIPPTHPLRPFVVSVFELRAERSYSVERILPRGEVSLLFNFGDPVRVDGRRTPFQWAQTAVSGLQTQPFLSVPGRRVHTMGLTLRPETCFTCLDVPLHELANGFVDGRVLVNDADQMLDRLGSAVSFDQRRDIVLDWLAGRTELDDTGRLVLAASRLLRQGPPAGAIARTSAQLGRSPRHLHRLFVERVGLSPARYVQLTRFVRALPLIGTTATLADVAVRAGYFDQAHFCRDFRALAEMTPDEYRQAGALVPGLIFSR
jgi:AraC-like DNA-binding protein